MKICDSLLCHLPQEYRVAAHPKDPIAVGKGVCAFHARVLVVREAATIRPFWIDQQVRAIEAARVMTKVHRTPLPDPSPVHGGLGCIA